MISLLLTLFISLFSICPSYNKVEDQYENNNILIDDSNYYQKNAIQTGSYIVIGIDELANNYFYNTVRGYFDYFTQPEHLGYWYSCPAAFQADITYIPTNMYEGLNDSDVPMLMRFESGNIYFMWGDLQEYGSTQSRFRCMALCIKHWSNPSGADYTLNLYGYSWFTAPFSNDYPNPYFNIYMQQSLDELNTAHRFYDYGLYISHELIVEGNNVDNVFYRFVYNSFILNNGVEEDIYNNGYAAGSIFGYQTGFNDGLDEVGIDDPVAFSIMTGIIDIGLLPVNVFLSILNFEVFGVNVSGLVSSFLTISIVIIIVRFLFGGKKND